MASIRIIEDRMNSESSSNPQGSQVPMVTIRNKRTGETKSVPATQAQNYGLDPEEAYRRVTAQTKLSNIEQGLPAEGTNTDPDSADVAKLKGAVTSGLESLKNIEDTLGIDKESEKPSTTKGNLKLFGARTGGLPIIGGDLTPFGRSLESDLYNIADVILRFRTGAQANPEEIRKFLKSKSPGITDSSEVRAQKVESFRTEIETVAEALGLSLEESKKKISSEGEDQGFSNAPNLDGIATVGDQQSTSESFPISPSLALSTAGDIAGGDVGPLSAILSGTGEFAGKLIEGESPQDAAKSAVLAGGVSATTPVALSLGGKVAKPIFEGVGNIVKNTIGKNLTKMGNSVLQKVAGDALDRGINVFDEAAAHGITSLPREEALSVIKQGFRTAEDSITQGIKEAGDPIVMSAKDLNEIFINSIDNLLDESDINSMNRLKDAIIKDSGGDIIASKALELKRKIFKKATGSSVANKEKFRIAGQINDFLKEGIPTVRDGLREEEILYYMDDIFRRLRNQEFVKGPTLNPFFLGQSVIRSAGPRRFAQAGQVVERAGQSIKNIPEVTAPALNAFSRVVRQPIRNLISE